MKKRKHTFITQKLSLFFISIIFQTFVIQPIFSQTLFNQNFESGSILYNASNNSDTLSFTGNYKDPGSSINLVSGFSSSYTLRAYRPAAPYNSVAYKNFDQVQDSIQIEFDFTMPNGYPSINGSFQIFWFGTGDLVGLTWSKTLMWAELKNNEIILWCHVGEVYEIGRFAVNPSDWNHVKIIFLTDGTDEYVSFQVNDYPVQKKTIELHASTVKSFLLGITANGETVPLEVLFDNVVCKKVEPPNYGKLEINNLSPSLATKSTGQNYSISGKMLDEQSNPVHGALVTVFDEINGETTVASASDGTFSYSRTVSTSAENTYAIKLLASKTGYSLSDTAYTTIQVLNSSAQIVVDFDTKIGRMTDAGFSNTADQFSASVGSWANTSFQAKTAFGRVFRIPITREMSDSQKSELISTVNHSLAIGRDLILLIDMSKEYGISASSLSTELAFLDEYFKSGQIVWFEIGNEVWNNYSGAFSNRVTLYANEVRQYQAAIKEFQPNAKIAVCAIEGNYAYSNVEIENCKWSKELLDNLFSTGNTVHALAFHLYPGRDSLSITRYLSTGAAISRGYISQFSKNYDFNGGLISMLKEKAIGSREVALFCTEYTLHPNTALINDMRKGMANALVYANTMSYFVNENVKSFLLHQLGQGDGQSPYQGYNAINNNGYLTPVGYVVKLMSSQHKEAVKTEVMGIPQFRTYGRGFTDTTGSLAPLSQVPYVTAIASKNEVGDSASLVLTNMASHSVSVSLILSKGFDKQLIRSISAPTILASNDDYENMTLSGFTENNSTTIQVPPFSVTQIQLFNEQVEPTPEADFYCEITAKASSFSDVDNKAGVSESSTDGFDADFDIPEPPHAPNGYISLYFPHTDWNHAEYDDFTRDIRSASGLDSTAKRWPFEVKTDQTSGNVSLAFFLSNIPAAYGVTCLDKDAGVLINLRDTTKYSYAAQSLRKFELLIGDSARPQIAFVSPSAGQTFFHGDTVKIAWTASDAAGVMAQRVYATPISSGAKTLLAELASDKTSYAWLAPKEMTGEVQISVAAVDSMFNETEISLASAIKIMPREKTYLPGWTLIGAPFMPTNTDADSVLGRFVPNYYYLFDYKAGQGFSVSDKVEHTKGYWFTSPDTVTVKITGSLADTASLLLKAGWNIVGNALYDRVPTSALKVQKGSETKSFDEAATAGWLSPACYGFSAGDAGYSQPDTLDPWKGYWLAAIVSNLTLIFDGDELDRTEMKSMTTQSFATATSTDSSADWKLQITAKSGTEADMISVCGTDANATDEFDASFDLPEPPQSPKKNGVSLYFSHENWPEVLGDKYNADIRAPLADKESKSWEFEVENTNAVTLSWNAPSISGLSLRLEDLSNGQVINMLTENEHAYTGSEAEPVRKFKLTATRDVSAVEETEAATPYEYALAQNYPNPFNPSTTIRFSLKQAGMATFRVFDLLGREILSEQIVGKAGWNTYTFKANALSSGIYFYRLQAGAFSETKKMMLLR